MESWRAPKRSLDTRSSIFGENQCVKLSRLIELLEQTLGKKAMIDRLSNQPGDVPVTYADISKAEKLLGYHPRIKIEAGIKLFIDWFKKDRRN